MADHYVRWLIAGGNAFLPAPASITKLVDRLKKESWLPADGGVAITTVENTFGSGPAAQAAKEKARRAPAPESLGDWLADGEHEEVRLVWAVPDATAAGLKYPLTEAPAGAAAYALEVHRADEYVYPSAKTIGKIPTLCNCKEDESFEWDEEEVVPTFEHASGIFAECEACSRTFEPVKGTAIITNAFDAAKKEEVRGGAAYRFALAVVCDAWVTDPSLRFHPELVKILETEFGRSFYEVGALV